MKEKLSIQPVVTTASNIFVRNIPFIFSIPLRFTPAFNMHVVSEKENDVEIGFPWKFILDNQLSIKYPMLVILLRYG